MKPTTHRALRLLFAVLLLTVTALQGLACTSAIVSRGASASGRTLLWKHRDSGHPDNFVDRVQATDSTMAYVALFNAGDSARAEAWAGFNEAGFAVMNTASYNLAPDTASVKDREGLVMSRALARCRTVADFIGVLRDEMAGGRSAGIQANFGVTDATGAGAYIEASDHFFEVFPLDSVPQGWAVRSNYCYGGGPSNRLGQVRHDNATHLLSAIYDHGHKPSHATFTDTLSRSFYHAGSGKDLIRQSRSRLLTDRGEYIPRRSSCSSVVIEGPAPGEDPAEGTAMWITIGWPTLSDAVRMTLRDIPAGLLPDPATGRSQLCDEANRLRDRAYPRRDSQGRWLIDAAFIRRELGRREKQHR